MTHLEYFQQEVQDLKLDAQTEEKIQPIFEYYERQLKGCGDNALRLAMIGDWVNSTPR